MASDKEIEMAMFRFGLIAPVINGTFTESSKTAYYRQVTSEKLTLPDGTSYRYSPSTLRYWEDLYRKNDFDGLVCSSRADKGYSRKLSAEAKDAIYVLKKQFPRINATLIRERLITDGVITDSEVSLSTIQRFVKTNAFELKDHAAVKDRKAFEAEYVCQLWQADTLYGPYVSVGNKKQRAYLITILDDKSRIIVGSRFFLADNAPNFQKVFKGAIIRFGLPLNLYVDNGSPYKNGQLSGICGRLGVVLIHTPVRDGASKGKIEKFNRSVRDRFLAVLPDGAKKSLEALNDAYVSWVNTYNTSEHSAIDSTPMKVYQKGIGDVKTPTDTQWVEQCFLNIITRKVRNDATISIDKVSYDVPMSLIGSKVEIRYIPGDIDSAHITDKDKAYPIRPTNKTDNFKTKREKNPYGIDYSSEGGDE